jgi:hypothetical protein
MPTSKPTKPTCKPKSKSARKPKSVKGSVSTKKSSSKQIGGETKCTAKLVCDTHSIGDCKDICRAILDCPQNGVSQTLNHNLGQNQQNNHNFGQKQQNNVNTKNALDIWMESRRTPTAQNKQKSRATPRAPNHQKPTSFRYRPGTTLFDPKSQQYVKNKIYEGNVFASNINGNLIKLQPTQDNILRRGIQQGSLWKRNSSNGSTFKSINSMPSSQKRTQQ